MSFKRFCLFTSPWQFFYLLLFGKQNYVAHFNCKKQNWNRVYIAKNLNSKCKRLKYLYSLSLQDFFSYAFERKTQKSNQSFLNANKEHITQTEIRWNPLVVEIMTLCGGKALYDYTVRLVLGAFVYGWTNNVYMYLYISKYRNIYIYQVHHLLKCTNKTTIYIYTLETETSPCNAINLFFIKDKVNINLNFLI